MDLDAIFDGKEPAIPPEINPAEATPPAAAEAPAEAVAAPEPQPEPTTAPQAKDGPMAPVAALLDERDRRKAAEQRLAELEAQMRQQQPQDMPDPYDDPAGYQAHVAQQLQAQAVSVRFDVSETLAREKHGDEAVTAAMDWGLQKAQTSPAFRDEYLAQKNPIDWVVRQQKREGLLSAVGDDEEAFIRRRAAELGLIAPTDAGAGTTPVSGQQQAPRPAAPPRSIASAASATGSHREIATGPLAAVDALFKG
jgi:hypothetical protein